MTLNASSQLGVKGTATLAQISLGISTANTTSSKIAVYDNIGSNFWGIGLTSYSSVFGLGLFSGTTATGTPQAILTQSGRFLIGATTESTYLLDVNGTGRFSGNVTVETATPLFVLQASTTGTFHGIEFRQGAGLDASIKQLPASGELRISSGRSVGWGGDISFYTDTVLALSISNTGTALFASSVTASSFFESSDSRLKTLIQDNYQTKGIASITPKLYTKNGKVELGYYAQDFVGILDSAVSKGSDDMLSLSYREVLVAKVYALEQEIKELKAKLN
jgi:hypothetical protein